MKLPPPGTSIAAMRHAAAKADGPHIADYERGVVQQFPFKVRIANDVHGTDVTVDGHAIRHLTNVKIEHRVHHGPVLTLEMHAGPQEIDAVGEVAFDWAGQKFTVADAVAARAAGLEDLAARMEAAMGGLIARDLEERVNNRRGAAR